MKKEKIKFITLLALSLPGFLIQCKERLRTVHNVTKATLVLCPFYAPKSLEESRSIRHLIGSRFLEKGYALVFWEEAWGDCKQLPQSLKLSGELVEREDFRTGQRTWFVAATLSDTATSQIHTSFWSDKDPYHNQRVWLDMGEELWESWESFHTQPKSPILTKPGEAKNL